MMRFARLVLVSLLGACLAAPLTAQDSTSFDDLRPDGNGVRVLRTQVSLGITNQTAGSALSLVAREAGISLTYEPTHRNFQTLVNIPAHTRSLAVALLEIAKICDARVLVSLRGQVVVSPYEGVRAQLGRVEVADTAKKTALPAVRVEALRTERLSFDNALNVNSVTMNAEALRATPMFVEPDVLKSIQLLPGIEARSDWSAGFNVRGGESDQSLIMLDGYPIYNPFHLGGVFSTFIDPAVGKVELHMGGLPARFGGRLSGALDVSSAQPTTNERHGTVELSLISSMFTMGRTFDSANGSWLVAARRSYADVVVNFFQTNGFPYHFEDVQTRVDRRLGSNWRLSATGYLGRDKASGDTVNSPYGGWGNSVLGISLARGLGAWRSDSAFVEQRASWTRFWAVGDASEFRSRVDNDVTDYRATGSLKLHRGSASNVFGYEVSTQKLRYQAATVFADLGGFFPVDSVSGQVHTASLFTENTWRPSANFLVDAGLRLDLTDAGTGAGLSPRISAKYFLSHDVAISAGAGRYSQWLHSLGRGEEPLQPFQFWVPTPAGKRVSVMHDATLGLERWKTPTQIIHVGAYFKRYDHLQVPSIFSDPLVPNDELTELRGTSYGLDFLWRQLDGGDFSGWMSYSYALSSRTDQTGYQFFPTQDRRHNLNLVGSWRDDAFTWGLRANIASGLPTTPVTGQFSRDRYDALTRKWVLEPLVRNQVIADPFNSDRLPFYLRIDASVTREGRLFGLAMKPYLSVVNVTNASNPAAYLYSFSGRPNRASLPNLPFVPTFGVSIAY